MEPISTSCPGIDMKKVKLFVRYDLEDMRVSGDKESGRVVENVRPDTDIIVPGVTSDMGHPDIQFLPYMTLMTGKGKQTWSREQNLSHPLIFKQ